MPCSCSGRVVSAPVRPHDDVGLLAGDQRFAFDERVALQRVGLGAVFERHQLGALALAQHGALLPRIGRERQQDLAVGPGGVLAAAEPQQRVLLRRTGLVEHGERLAAGGRALGVAQPALVDHGAAADAVADELDDVGARRLQHRQVEVAAHAAQRRLLVLERLLVVGDEAIELDRRVDVLLLLDEVAIGVDDVDLQQ